jgi:hypothetical protein
MEGPLSEASRIVGYDKCRDKAQTHNWVADYGGGLLVPAVPVRMSNKQRQHDGYDKT